MACGPGLPGAVRGPDLPRAVREVVLPAQQPLMHLDAAAVAAAAGRGHAARSEAEPLEEFGRAHGVRGEGELRAVEEGVELRLEADVCADVRRRRLHHHAEPGQ
eukprot:scaffold48213_cov68-Phaeocystis_antarctica.AAC.3